jgi:hypothetical protein
MDQDLLGVVVLGLLLFAILTACLAYALMVGVTR